MTPAWLIAIVVLAPFAVLALILGMAALGDRGNRWDEGYRTRMVVRVATLQALLGAAFAVSHYRDGNPGLGFWLGAVMFLLASGMVIHEVLQARQRRTGVHTSSSSVPG